MSPPKFVILDFDGTLFDTHEAIAHSITKTFNVLLPTHPLQESEVQRLIGSGKGLHDVLTTLHPEPSTLEEDLWISTYRRIYADEGQQLVKPFAGAHELLKGLKTKNIPMAIITNKNVVAVTVALENHDLGDCIQQELIIGDRTPGATRKPDPGSYHNILIPNLKNLGFSQDFNVSDVVVVGDTPADLQFASNIGGARSVWCRFGYGDKTICENLKPYATVDSLGEVESLLLGEKN